MRILIINSEYPPIGGGAGNASAHIARELARFGQEVTVLTAGYKGLPARQDDKGVRVVRLPSLRRMADRSTAFEQIVFMLSAALLGLPIVLRLRPQIALAFFGAPSGAAAWFWSFFVSLPYVVALRGGDVPGFRPYDFGRVHRRLAPLLRRVWRRAAAVVANSQGLRDLGHAFEPKVPIAVIPNGVNLEKFKVGERAWQPPRLLFVGRIVYQKGLDLLLDALAQLKQPVWTLDIVGDGPRMEKLQAQAKELGIANRLNFLGWQHGDELVRRYTEANLFVYPSRHEGMPNAVLEAMACGLPVLASQIAGNEELVAHKETGLLVPSEDANALQIALGELLPDSAARQRMGAAARKRVEAQYSWQRVGQEYLELVQHALESK
jgi:glycosyltransferase involved in cell wall biosynthesis